LTICLSIAGISVAQTQIVVAQNLFIVILFFCLLALFMQGVYKLLKTNGTSKYEISDKKSGKKMRKETKKEDAKESKEGKENHAFDAEKGEGKEEKWVKNYVPYDEYPDGRADSVTVEAEGEQKRRDEEKGEKENKDDVKDEKWKANYVPYEKEEEAEEEKE